MRTVVLYSVLLTAAMVGSYLSWTAEETSESRAEEVAVYRASEGDVKAVSFHADDLDVKVERRSDARGDYTWIEVEERKVPPKPPTPDEPEEAPDDGAPSDEAGPEAGADDETDGPTVDTPDAPAEPVEPEVKRMAFTGGEKAMGLLGSFEPLMAKRELDASLVDAPNFGFDEPEGTVTVARTNGGEESLVIGSSTYGTRDRYARHGDKLFLLGDTLIRPLQFAATRLRERRLQPWVEGDVDTLTLQREGKTLALEQRNRDDRAKAFWARPDDDTEDEAAATWAEKLFRLRADTSTDAPAGDLTPLLTVELQGEGEAWTWTLLTDGTEDGRFVRSDFLRDTVRVGRTLADEIQADLDEILAN